MAKVSCGMGLNIEAVKGARFDRFTPSFSISDIDVDGDYKEQVRMSLEVGEYMWGEVSKFIERKCTEEVQRSIEIGKNI